jgi:hypothetical protein
MNRIEIEEYLNEKFLDKPSFENFYVFEKVNTVYFGMHKCANSSIRYLLYCNENDSFEEGFKSARLKIYNSNLPLVSDTGWLAEKLISPAFKFTFVRSPYDRILSCWKNKIFKPSGFDRDDQRYKSKLAILNSGFGQERFSNLDISFGEFVESIVEQESNDMDRHWAPMVDLLRPDLVNYDYIGKVESFEQNINFLCGKKGWKTPKQVHINQSKVKTPSDFSDAYIKKLIYQRYECDFQYFEYPKP